MKNTSIAKILSFIVIGVGCMVSMGWFLDIPLLKSILPHWVTMKFSTAAAFIASGAVLYYVVESQRGKKAVAQMVLPVAALLILLLMATLLMSVLLGIRTGIEDLFVKEEAGAVKTTTPGRPSVGTMVDFILIGVTGLLAVFNPEGMKKALRWIGLVVAIVGGLAILGYIINAPVLYYTIAGFSTAMAMHTAILFTLIGIGFWLLGKGDN